MKKLYFFTVLLLIFSSLHLSAEPVYDFSSPEISAAINQALEQVKPALNAAYFGTKNIAILPIISDKNGNLTNKLKTLITGSGHVLVEASQDPMWNSIIEEIGWTERKNDILDASAIAKFGKLKSVQILFYAVVRVDRNKERIFVELDLHATEVETRRHIWGHNSIYPHYVNKDVEGLVSLDEDLRKLIKKNFAEALDSLKKSTFITNPGKYNIQTVAVLSLAGDIDNYITGLAKELLNNANLAVQEAKVTSPFQFREDKKNVAGAPQGYLYGAVRNLSRKYIDTTYTKDKRVLKKWLVSTDIQLTIGDIKSGNELWNRTITLSENMIEERLMTDDEIAQRRDYKLKTFLDDCIEWAIDNRWQTFLIVGACIAVLVVLTAFIFVLKFFMSNRFIR